MAWRLDDRWLWLGSGAAFFVIAKGIAYGLKEILRLTEIDDDIDTKSGKTAGETEAEESISLEALQTLANSPEPDIANAAISLLVTRFASSAADTTRLTLQLFSPNPLIRASARRVLILFDTYPLPADYPNQHVLDTRAVKELLKHKGGNDPQITWLCTRFFKAMDMMKMRGGQTKFATLAKHMEDAWQLHGSATAEAEQELGPRGQRTADSRFTIHNPAIIDIMNTAGDGVADLGDLELSVESLDQLLTQIASTNTPRPVRIPATTLSALLRANPGVDGNISPGSGDPGIRSRLREESPEEAEVRRRRREAMVLQREGGEVVIHPHTRPRL